MLYREIGIRSLCLVLLMLCFQSVAAQHHRSHARHSSAHSLVWLSGRVVEKDDTGVAFATIYIEGKKHGGFTDDKGNFRIKAPPHLIMRYGIRYWHN